MKKVAKKGWCITAAVMVANVLFIFIFILFCEMGAEKFGSLLSV